MWCEGSYCEIDITHTLHGVFGMARTTLAVFGTQVWSWAMVTPAQMEMTSLPSNADSMPSS